MVTIERRPARHWGVPGSVGESPLLGGVWRPPLPAGALSCPAPPLPRPLQAGGGGGGAGRGRPAGRVGVLVVVGVVGTSGRAGGSSAPGPAVPSW